MNKKKILFAVLALGAIAGAFIWWKRRQAGGIASGAPSDASNTASPNVAANPNSTAPAPSPVTSSTTPAAGGSQTTTSGTTTTTTTTPAPDPLINGVPASTLNAASADGFKEFLAKLGRKGKVLIEGSDAYQKAEKKYSKKAIADYFKGLLD